MCHTLSAGNTEQLVAGTGTAGAGGANVAIKASEPTTTTRRFAIPRMFRVIGPGGRYG